MKKKFRSIFDKNIREDQEYPEDIDRICSVLESHGYEAPREYITRMWRQYSEEFCAAGWIILPQSDEDLWKEISSIIEDCEG